MQKSKDSQALRASRSPRERVAAAIEPHGFAALAGAVVGHAGGAPGWRYDLAARSSVRRRVTAGRGFRAEACPRAAFVGLLPGLRWCRK